MSFPYHPLIDPNKEGATTEQNHAWLATIREIQPGEARLDLINIMIEANIPLAFLKLKTFIQLFPGFKFIWDDMVSEGMLALVEGVHKLGDMSPPGEEDVDNPMGYVGMMIVRRVGKMLDKATEKLPARYRSPLSITVDPRRIVEERDLLEAACSSTIDRTIIQMRERGNNQSEIADALELSQSSVSVFLHEIKTRYDILNE